MKTLITRLFVIGCLSTALTTQLSALTISDPGVVGTAAGLAGDTQNGEDVIAQHLLDLGANVVNNLYLGRRYDTGPTNYNGTISSVMDGQDVQGNVVPAGFEYALAKYDGQSAGYVLFNLADWGSNVLPQYSYTIWGSNAEQYAISHFTPFNTEGGDIPGVPDGGLTVVMMGLALCGIEFIRRRVRA